MVKNVINLNDWSAPEALDSSSCPITSSLERYQMTMAMETLTPLISHTTSSSAINPSFLFDIAKPMAKIDLSWNRLEFDMTKVRFPHHLNYLDLSHNSIKGRVAKSLKDIIWSSAMSATTSSAARYQRGGTWHTMGQIVMFTTSVSVAHLCHPARMVSRD